MIVSILFGFFLTCNNYNYYNSNYNYSCNCNPNDPTVVGRVLYVACSGSIGGRAGSRSVGGSTGLFNKLYI